MHILHLNQRNQRNQILFQYLRDKKKKERRRLRKRGGGVKFTHFTSLGSAPEVSLCRTRPDGWWPPPCHADDPIWVGGQGVLRFTLFQLQKIKHCFVISRIDLVTVFDAILTRRQTCEKLWCLYENLMSNNFRKTAVLKRIWFVN